MSKIKNLLRVALLKIETPRAVKSLLSSLVFLGVIYAFLTITGTSLTVRILISIVQYLMIVLGVLLFFLVRRLMRKDDFILEHGNEYFKVDEGGVSFTFKSNKPGENPKFKPAVQDDLLYIQDIDRKAETWVSRRLAPSWADKKALLEAHIAQNDNSVLLIMDQTKIPIGYTHIIPINQNVCEQYETGQIGKADFDRNMVLPNGTVPGGLVILSLVYPPHKKARFKSHQVAAGHLVLEALAYQVDAYFMDRSMLRKASLNAYIQNEKNSIDVFFRPQANVFRECADGNVLFKINIQNRYKKKPLKTFIFPKKFIVFDSEQKPIIKPHNELGQFSFANKNNIISISEMNARAFRRRRWNLDEEVMHEIIAKKSNRNSEHIKRNSLCIQAIYSKDKKTLIGFTHLIPVDNTVWNKYIIGEIIDGDFSSSHVQPKSKKNPFGLIIFTAAIGGRNPDIERSYKNECGELLEQALAFHLGEIFKEQFRQTEYVKVLFKNWDTKIKSHFKDADDSKELWTNLNDKTGLTFLKVQNPFFVY